MPPRISTSQSRIANTSSMENYGLTHTMENFQAVKRKNETLTVRITAFDQSGTRQECTARSLGKDAENGRGGETQRGEISSGTDSRGAE